MAKKKGNSCRVLAMACCSCDNPMKAVGDGRVACGTDGCEAHGEVYVLPVIEVAPAPEGRNAPKKKEEKPEDDSGE